MVNPKISPELLAAVLNKKLIDHTYKHINKNIYYHEEGVIYAQTINVFELANLCKQWALNKRYVIKSWIGTSGCGIDIINNMGIEEYFQADTEPEAVFKSCEWLLRKEV